MWIRSQSRAKLVDSNNLCADGTKIKCIVNSGMGFYLGAYNSEAEAVQVLAMIEKHINDLAFVQYTESCVEFVRPVFQMPKAGFSADLY